MTTKSKKTVTFRKAFKKQSSVIWNPKTSKALAQFTRDEPEFTTSDPVAIKRLTDLKYEVVEGTNPELIVDMEEADGVHD